MERQNQINNLIPRQTFLSWAFSNISCTLMHRGVFCCREHSPPRAPLTPRRTFRSADRGHVDCLYTRNWADEQASFTFIETESSLLQLCLNSLWSFGPARFRLRVKSHSFSVDGSLLSRREAFICFFIFFFSPPFYQTKFGSLQHISFTLPASPEVAAHQSRKWRSPTTDNLVVARSGGPCWGPTLLCESMQNRWTLSERRVQTWQFPGSLL